MIAIIKNVLFGINRHHNNRSPLDYSQLLRKTSAPVVRRGALFLYHCIISLFDKSKHLFNRYSHDVIRLALVDDEELTIAEEFLVRWGSMDILYRSRFVYIVHATKGLVIWMIGCVEAVILSPCAEHDRGLCSAAAGNTCTFGRVMHNAID